MDGALSADDAALARRRAEAEEAQAARLARELSAFGVLNLATVLLPALLTFAAGLSGAVASAIAGSAWPFWSGVLAATGGAPVVIHRALGRDAHQGRLDARRGRRLPLARRHEAMADAPHLFRPEDLRRLEDERADCAAHDPARFWFAPPRGGPRAGR